MVSVHLSEKHLSWLSCKEECGSIPDPELYSYSSGHGQQPAAAYQSSMLFLCMLPACSVMMHFRNFSTPASPCKSHPSRRQGFALSLLLARQMPAAFLIVSISKCLGKDVSLSSCLPCLLWLCPCSLPALPSFSPSLSHTLTTRQLVLWVEKLLLPLKLVRNQAVKAPSLDVESMVISVKLPEPKLSWHVRWRWKEADRKGHCIVLDYLTFRFWAAAPTDTSSPG